MNEGELYTQYSATKKKYLSTDLFLTSCGFFVDLCVCVCVCVCMCVLHVYYVCLSLYYAARGGGGDHGALIPS